MSGPSSLREAARVFRALSSEARLCIVQELRAHQEWCAGDLVGCCGLGWSTVSHHLAILRAAGIVQDEKRGKQVFYRLALPCISEVLDCLQLPEGACGQQNPSSRKKSSPNG